jgi:hypothetical protein
VRGEWSDDRGAQARAAAADVAALTDEILEVLS